MPTPTHSGRGVLGYVCAYTYSHTLAPSSPASLSLWEPITFAMISFSWLVRRKCFPFYFGYFFSRRLDFPKRILCCYFWMSANWPPNPRLTPPAPPSGLFSAPLLGVFFSHFHFHLLRY